MLGGFDAIVMSNEHSASAPNLSVGGAEINHQFSKSLEFEREFAGYIASHISPSIAYFSLLRPLSEIEIARRFARYRAIFPAFPQLQHRVPAVARPSAAEHWCGDCPKCRFVFLALAPFVAKPELIGIFGRNLLDDESQLTGLPRCAGCASTSRSNASARSPRAPR